MITEIISTGTELLLGQIVNTNAQYLANKLNELGFDVLFQSTVGDNPERMAEVIRHALARADIIITTGGLGPTQGDITKQVTARVLERPMFLHEASVEQIKAFFAARNIDMPENNLRQAMMPEGAIIIDNERGTAPGVIIRAGEKTVIHLPGPPREMKWMFEHSIIPYLQQHFGIQGIIRSRVLRTFGAGESALEEKIKDFIFHQSNPTIALLARSGEVHLRLTAKAASAREAEHLLAGLEAQIRERVGNIVFGVDAETLEQVAGKLLCAKNLTIALAESCTGGLLTSRLTDIPGSSGYVVGSVICYSNQIKLFLGVPAAMLAEHGAVSRETAIEMAAQVRKKFKTDIGVGVTGIAGPGGATENKPVGLVYIALDGPNGVQCQRYHFFGQRTDIKQRAALAALLNLKNYVEQL